MATHPLSRYKKIHLIGIKGAGMTALAELLLRQGATITGSDTEEVFFTDSILKKLGILVRPFASKNISARIDLVIHSTVYTAENNTELAVAQKQNIPIMSYPEALGALTKEKLTLAVCGTHGKTTTSALLADTLKFFGKDPSAIVGSRIMNWVGNALAGSGEYLVIEADEYQNKLAHYSPFAVILTSVDWDHPDFFPDVESYKRVFDEFVARIPAHGTLVYCADSASVARIAALARCRTVSYGALPGADFQVVEYVPEKMNFVAEKEALRQSFSVIHGGKKLGPFRLRLAGIHNAKNATAVLALLTTLGLDNKRLVDAFQRFSGTERRFEYIGERYGARIYDDYAHHPEEIRATLQAFRDLYPDKKLSVIFHPHTFTRTKALLTDFAQSFDVADHVRVLDIYGSAREVQATVSATDLVELINRFFPNKAEHVTDTKALVAELQKTIGRQDVIITLGAGNVWEISHALVKHT
ncbi:MAG: UDP-N-acetylmuramate--L-alanine ligase [Candidatus Moranbacteria bacterium]|nr:UDP-N-acetylmuramate--L-alanine ligase [Candidatus Moranbacteria bacterium]